MPFFWIVATDSFGCPEHGECGRVLDPETEPLLARALLEKLGRGDIDAGTRILDQHDAEAGLAEITGRVEAADVRREPTDDHGRNLLGPVKGEQPRMLGSHGIR